MGLSDHNPFPNDESLHDDDLLLEHGNRHGTIWEGEDLPRIALQRRRARRLGGFNLSGDGFAHVAGIDRLTEHHGPIGFGSGPNAQLLLMARHSARDTW